MALLVSPNKLSNRPQTLFKKLKKRYSYSNRAVGNCSKAHSVVKEVIYEANKDSETYSFNTTCTVNYSIQLAMPLNEK